MACRVFNHGIESRFLLRRWFESVNLFCYNNVMKNRGFGLIEILLVVVIVAVVGGTGWYVTRLNNEQTAVTAGLNAEEQARQVVGQANQETQHEQDAINQIDATPSDYQYGSIENVYSSGGKYYVTIEAMRVAMGDSSVDAGAGITDLGKSENFVVATNTKIMFSFGSEDQRFLSAHNILPDTDGKPQTLLFSDLVHKVNAAHYAWLNTKSIDVYEFTFLGNTVTDIQGLYQP